MKTEEIIELAKKAGFTYTDIKLTAIGHRIETFAALHREALIESGELVEKEKAQKDIKFAKGLWYLMHGDTDDFDAALDRARSQP